MIYIANSFSLQMVPTVPSYYLSIEEVDKLPSNGVSCIGHADTARILGLPYNRQSITLEWGDILYVAQLMGGRLPEGATTLPTGYYFKYYKIEVLADIYNEINIAAIESGMPY